MPRFVRLLVLLGGLVLPPARLAAADQPLPGGARAQLGEVCLGREEGVRLLAYSPDGKTLATVAGLRTLRLWDVNSGTLLETLSWSDDGEIRAVAFARDGDALHVKASHGRCTGARTRSGLAITCAAVPTDAPTLTAEDSRIRAAVSPVNEGGKEEPGPLVVWATPVRRGWMRLAGRSDGVVTAAVSPDERLIAGGDKEGVVSLWETATGQEVLRFRGDYCPVLALSFSPDGQVLAAGGQDHTVHLWRIGSGKLLRHLIGHRGMIHAVAFSPDGRSLASGSRDETVLLWDVATLGDRDGRAREPAPEELDGLWGRLGGPPAAAFVAVETLAAVPGQAVPLLGDRLDKLNLPARKPLAAWVADLDSPSFEEREAAVGGLGRAGAAAEALLREVLDRRPSLEVRHRVEQILNKPMTTFESADELTVIRGVQALERIGNKEAVEVLRSLSARHPATLLGVQARAALERLRSSRRRGP